jgi:hypothetical protein
MGGEHVADTGCVERGDARASVQPVGVNRGRSAEMHDTAVREQGIQGRQQEEMERYFPLLDACKKRCRRVQRFDGADDTSFAILFEREVTGGR